MNISQVDKIPIEDWLEKVEGIKPSFTSSGGQELHYHSPIRNDDEHPSFVVNTQKQVWIDNATRDSGKTFSMIKLMYNLSPKEALALVRRSIFNNPSLVEIVSPGLNPARSNPKPQVLNARRFLKLVANNDIKHPALVQYYHDRGISDKIAKQYLREIHYLTTSGANMFAIGIPAGDGFEVSSSLGVGKAYVGEHASYTHLNIGATVTVLVFEGFIDALSFISKYSEYANHSIIILNSTKHATAILSELKQYSTIELWLDKDSSGDTATDIISEAFPQTIQDMRTELNNFNDVNDWIRGKKYTRD